MKELFRINTNLFSLVWERSSKCDPPVLRQRAGVSGRLTLTPHPGVTFEGDNWRSDVPPQLQNDPELELGPACYEQTDYQVYLKAHRANDEICLQHRDPVITQRLSSREQKRVMYGVINFQSQIGLSQFTVAINGKPQLDFEVEVFPTKIDYETDYKEIVSQIQEILASLAYEYLRATHQLGKLDSKRRPSRTEWLILLEHILAELEDSIRYIAQQPRRSLVRQAQYSRAERIRRVDSSIRAQVRRGAGRGMTLETSIGSVRERLLERPAEPTLDTMEHRWIRRQLLDIQRTLSLLYNSIIDTESGGRNQNTQTTIRAMERRVAQLLRFEPIAEANGPVPGEFASLQLVSAPGYRETYRLCMLLKFGLRLEGDLYRMSVKDLNLLYEYWVFLSIVQLLREPNVSASGLRDLFKLNRSSLQVRLLEGQRQRITCVNSSDRKISVTYNLQYDADNLTLLPQKPDVAIHYEEVGWPQMLLICDAKYRIDASEEYRQQFGSFGPPRDAVNVLHRYRDAILGNEARTKDRPNHVVVQAVAVFPHSELQPQEFKSSRLWQSIDSIGIGAIPALPSNLSYMREWLVQSFRQGGWSMADRAIPHVAETRARDWLIAAREPVVVATLRPDNAREHFEWIVSNQTYYMRFFHSQPLQFRVKQVAIYSPKGFPNGSAITHVADVLDVSVIRRCEITTPWSSHRSKDEDRMVLYHLGPLYQLPKSIKNPSSDNSSIQSHRWTTRLGLQRARVLSEIAMGTEHEWKLYEKLTASRTPFQIVLAPLKKSNSATLAGRAVFQIDESTTAKYDGANGFLVSLSGNEMFLTSVDEVAECLMARVV